jgi:hypothetical protein
MPPNSQSSLKAAFFLVLRVPRLRISSEKRQFYALRLPSATEIARGSVEEQNTSPFTAAVARKAILFEANLQARTRNLAQPVPVVAIAI